MITKLLPPAIGIMGLKGSGKTTLAMLISDIQHEMFDIKRYHRNFADELRMDLAEMHKIPVLEMERQETKAKYRKLMQQYGTDMREKHGEDYWCTRWFLSIRHEPFVTASDVRFPAEVDMIRDLGGVIVRVDRPDMADNDDHISEHAWRDVTPDVIIYNNGDMLALRDQAAYFIEDQVKLASGRTRQDQAMSAVS